MVNESAVFTTVVTGALLMLGIRCFLACATSIMQYASWRRKLKRAIDNKDAAEASKILNQVAAENPEFADQLKDEIASAA